MEEIIARIKLAPGELGYYDELSGTLLTPANPIKDIVRGTNCNQLRRSAQCHRISVIAGSLGDPLTIRQILKLDPVDYNYSYLPALNKSAETKQTESNIQSKKEPAAHSKESVTITSASPKAASKETEATTVADETAAKKTTPKENAKTEVQLAITPTSIRSLKIGATRSLSANIENTKFKSQNEKIATVSEQGEVKGIAVGKTSITATADKQTVEISVNVVDAEVK